MQKIGVFQPPDEKLRVEAIGPLAGFPIKIKKAIPAIIPFFEPIPRPREGDWLWENDEDGQSFSVYENSRKNYVSDKNKTIYILPLELNMEKEFLATIKKLVKAFYTGMKIKVKKAIDITKMNVTTRISETTKKIQYHGPSIMDAVTSMLPSDGYGMMCILL